MRLIDADAVEKQAYDDVHYHAELEDWEFDVVTHYLDHATTIDAVPVVRCKDCEQSRETNMFGERTVLICGKTDYVKQPDGYCDEGDRKDGDG